MWPRPATNLIPTTGADAGVVPQFTFNQLQTLYKSGTAVTAANNGVTYFPYSPGSTVPSGDVPVDLYVPQNGSGTLKFWSQQLGFTVGSTTPWIYQTIQTDAGAAQVGEPGELSADTQFQNMQVEEHDGTAVTVDPNGLFPFSIAQYISQHNGHNPRFHGAQILSVGGVAPEASGKLNPAFPNTLLREVYNVVAWDRVVNTGDGNFDPVLAGAPGLDDHQPVAAVPADVPDRQLRLLADHPDVAVAAQPRRRGRRSLLRPGRPDQRAGLRPDHRVLGTGR